MPELLSTLPNLGPKIIALLNAVGIDTPNDLRRAGAIEAALRIRRLRPDDPPCRSLLAGLDGAIRGVRWHGIPKEERERLWREYEAHA